MFNKFAMLATTTALTLVSSTAAYAADDIYPAAALNGNGASSIVTILNQEGNCFGGPNNQAGFSDGTTQTIPDFTYAPAKTAAANPNYNCATQSFQPNIDIHYVSTGSGGGKNNWKNLNTAAITTNPFTYGSHIQFAFSDSPISSGDLSTYNTTAAPTAGAGIQVPMFVLPVAVAYSATYGKIKTSTGVVPLAFNLKFPRADGTGGLRLSKATYCGIFNGSITNFNNAAFTADNGGQSLMSPSDSAARWNSTGVPIVLIGRFDNSGTTNIFSRHLTAACAGVAGNKFTAGGADQLPGTAISSAVYGQQSGLLVSGTETPGSFGRVPGSDGVATTIDLPIADPTTVGAVNLNGRLGYVGADWVRPSVLSGSGVLSADLQIGGTGTVAATKSTKYAGPTAANATLAFGNTVAPQSATNGKYNPGSPAATSLPGNRNDPLAWAFPATINFDAAHGGGVNPLANPAAGYAITGTTNMLLYTCYADPAVRNAVQGFALFHFAKQVTDSTGTKVPPKLASNTALGTDGKILGIDPKNGVAPLPAAFANGIIETFLTKVTSGNNPAALNLWIQDKQQKKTTDVTAANSTCAGIGA